MHRILALIIVALLSCFCSNAPEAPSQEYCERAFSQIPDHKDFSKVDKNAFSEEFRGLLEKAYAAADKEERENPGEIGDYEFLIYWYDGNGEPLLESEGSSIDYEIGEVKEGRSIVDITIYTPVFAPYGHAENKFAMHLLYEDKAWRIDDWINPEFGKSMKSIITDYLAR